MKRLVMGAGLLLAAGCGGALPADLGSYKPLDSLRSNGQAVVRVYAAVVPVLAAEHTWFVIKRANSTDFHRWEGWLADGSPYGYIYEDLHPLESDVWGGGMYVVAELTGPEAEPIIDFIETQSPLYPCRYIYDMLSGPSSNGYTQWVLNQTGWQVELPAAAYGRDMLCTE